MSLNQAVRNLARTVVDGFYCSSAPGIERLGDQSSGWVIQTRPPPQVAYCAGVGQAITFELALAEITAQPVLVMDPSPTGVATMRALPPSDRLHFEPVGLAAENGTIEFSVPRKPGEGSYSVAQDDLEKIKFDCWSLNSILARRGDHQIDLLKMDIEGFEFDVLDKLLADGLEVRQICVEFHDWLQPGRQQKCIVGLRNAGYRIIYKNRGDYTFLRTR